MACKEEEHEWEYVGMPSIGPEGAVWCSRCGAIAERLLNGYREDFRPYYDYDDIRLLKEGKNA